MQVYEFDFILFKIRTEIAKRTLKIKEGKRGQKIKKKKEQMISTVQTGYDHHPHARRNIGRLFTMGNSGRIRLR